MDDTSREELEHYASDRLMHLEPIKPPAAAEPLLGYLCQGRAA